MFFSIAVSRVSPVLFPDASSEASSLFVAQSAVAILEKVMNVDRECKPFNIPLPFRVGYLNRIPHSTHYG
jgi:hypothetical protein